MSEHPTAGSPPPYRSSGERARLAMLALLGFVVVEILVLVADVGRVGITGRILGGQELADAEITSSDTLVRITAIIELAMLVLCAVLFLAWLHRVVANLPALGARELRYTPVWAVGWWFVPIANLVRPFQVMVEAWTASAPPGRDTGIGRLLPAWWGLLVLGGIVSRLVTVRAGGEDITGLHNAAIVDIIASVVMILAALLCVVVVRRLTERQELTHRALAVPVAAPAGAS